MNDAGKCVRQGVAVRGEDGPARVLRLGHGIARRPARVSGMARHARRALLLHEPRSDRRYRRAPSKTPTGTEAPWAVAVEFQSEPVSLMFGRLMIYLGHMWQALKPDPERGSRFNLGAVVINLTGSGGASRRMLWPGGQVAATHNSIAVLERRVVKTPIDLLVGIEGGRWSRALLPWLPLMTGGGDAGIIERWKQVAEGETGFPCEEELWWLGGGVRQRQQTEGNLGKSTGGMERDRMREC